MRCSLVRLDFAAIQKQLDKAVVFGQQFKMLATRLENPHCGMALLPFMKSTTSFFSTVSLIWV